MIQSYNLTPAEIDRRVALAVHNFTAGYNCAQSVVRAYADVVGLSEREATLIAQSFGGGIGRMRLTCGAACGMFMLCGAATGTVDPKDKAAKQNNVTAVRAMAKAFEDEHGSLTCAVLLGLDKTTAAKGGQGPHHSCQELVASAARIVGQRLMSQQVDEGRPSADAS